MMTINIISVQYNCGFHPDIILGNPAKYHIVALNLQTI